MSFEKIEGFTGEKPVIRDRKILYGRAHSIFSKDTSNKNMLRAKMYCESIRKDEVNEQENVSLRAVYSGSPENEQWSKFTPAGMLMMTISNPSAQGKLEQGKEYFIDITPAN